MGYLDKDGLAYLWQKIKTALAGKQDTITPGDGLSQDGDTLNVTTPVRGIVSTTEWDALTTEDQGKGLWIITPTSTNGWFSPKLTANDASAPYVATASSDMAAYGSSGIFAAFDDNPLTHWNNNNNDTTVWISLDFGEAVTLLGFSMQARTDLAPQQLPTNFDVQISIDGKNYTTIMSKSGLPSATLGEVREYLFDGEVETRYFKITNMTANSVNGPKFCCIANIRFFSNGHNYIKIAINGETVNIPFDNTVNTDTAASTISAQPNAAIQLSNSALDLSGIQAAPVTAAAVGVEIAGMKEV